MKKYFLYKYFILKKVIFLGIKTNGDTNPLNQINMKNIITTNSELLEVLASNGIVITCNENMEMQVTDEDAARIPGIVAAYAPAAAMDYTIE